MPMDALDYGCFRRSTSSIPCTSPLSLIQLYPALSRSTDWRAEGAEGGERGMEGIGCWLPVNASRCPYSSSSKCSVMLAIWLPPHKLNLAPTCPLSVAVDRSCQPYAIEADKNETTQHNQHDTDGFSHSTLLFLKTQP